MNIRYTILWIIFLLAISGQIQGEDFSNTNVQLLYGNAFNDWYYGYATSDKKMTTLTVEHFGLWSYGDNFFFVDLIHGDFGNGSNRQTNRIYAEWLTRLSLSRLSGTNFGLGFIKDICLAAQIDRGGDGYWANMAGVGIDCKLPGFENFGINALFRKDKFNQPSYLMTAVWSASEQWGPLNFFFEGYIDVAGTDNDGLDLNAQPQWLLSFQTPANNFSNHFRIGVEWYYHRNRQLTTSVPQVLVKWIW